MKSISENHVNPVVAAIIAALIVSTIALSSRDDKSGNDAKILEAISQIGSRLNSIESSRNNTRSEAEDSSANKAMAFARRELGQEHFEDAYDYVLAAMRIDPSSPQVYSLCVEFVEAAAQSKNDEAFGLAEDLYSRMPFLIPYQPVEEIKKARVTLEKMKEILEKTSPKVPGIENPESEGTSAESKQDEINELRKRIESLKKQIPEIPASVASSITRELRSRIEALGVAVFGTRIPNDFWEMWSDLDKELEQVELLVLDKMYKNTRKKLLVWEKTSEDILQEFDSAPTNAFKQLTPRFLQNLATGYEMTSEITVYANGGVRKASKDKKKIQKDLQRLEKHRAWFLNKYALYTIDYYKKDEKKGNDRQVQPMDKLKILAMFDEQRLIPYVQIQYRNLWDDLFEDLSESDKEKAVKLKIIGDISREK